MERRSFVKSLLPLAALIKSVLCSHTYHGELYKGKRLVVVSPDELQTMCKKRETFLPRFKPVRGMVGFKSERGIVDDMLRFVDMSEGHLDELGDEVYGCVHENGSYSVASFAPLHSHPKEYRVLLRNEHTA